MNYRIETYKYKIDINSSGNLMSIRMFDEELYPNTKNTYLNNSADKK